MSKIRIYDSDTGESSMDVVEVPEGYSFQMVPEDGADYISVIVSPEDANRLRFFLNGTHA